MYSNLDRQPLPYFCIRERERDRGTDINIDINTERRSGQSKRQRRGGHCRPRQCMTPTPPPLCFRRERERKRDRVARRPGPMQTQHHLLQWYLEWVSQVGQRERNQPRRIIGNNTTGGDRGGQRTEDRGRRGSVKGESGTWKGEKKSKILEWRGELGGERRAGSEGRRVGMMRSLINVWLTGVTLMPPTHNPPHTHIHAQADTQIYIFKPILTESIISVILLFPSPPIVTDDALVTMGTIKCHHQTAQFSRSRICAHVVWWRLVAQTSTSQLE